MEAPELHVEARGQTVQYVKDWPRDGLQRSASSLGTNMFLMNVVVYLKNV